MPVISRVSGSLAAATLRLRAAVAPVSWPELQLRGFSTTCRAVIIRRFGGPEVLELCPNFPIPELQPGEVLVRARAVSINPVDTQMRAGAGRSLFTLFLPMILGRDISGEVAAVGSSDQSFRIGEEVFGAHRPTAPRGTYADYAIFSQDEIARKPQSLTHVEASAIPFAALTAWRALRRTANIKKRVLIIGGGGAVGTAAIQLSVAAGCKVSTICGKQSINRLLELGAAQAIEYAKKDDIDLVYNLRFNAVLDTIGTPETESLGINLLNRFGHYMTLQGETAALSDRYGLLIGQHNATMLLLKKQCQYEESHGIYYWWTNMRTDSVGLNEISRLSDAGMLKIPVEKTFPITRVKEAHEVKDKRLVPGKVVLEFD